MTIILDVSPLIVSLVLLAIRLNKSKYSIVFRFKHVQFKKDFRFEQDFGLSKKFTLPDDLLKPITKIYLSSFKTIGRLK